MAEGVYQLKVPVPIPLVFVSAYLIEGEDGWTLLDTGFDNPRGREAWEAGARSVGCDLDRDVARILVSHFHPDHLGAARWLQERSGAPVYMLAGEIPHARQVWENPGHVKDMENHFTRNGMDPELARRAVAGTRQDVKLPDEILPLQEGDEISLGEGAATVVHAPGHADHQFMLHHARRRVLFAADHVLLKITPNIGLNPDTEPRPLARFIRHLEKLRGMDIDLVLPGHGPVFHDLDGRISELVSHHTERLDVMHDALLDGWRTPFEVSKQVFRDDLSLYERCFALSETLAHLEHLSNQGRVERVEDGVARFRSVSGARARGSHGS